MQFAAEGGCLGVRRPPSLLRRRLDGIIEVKELDGPVIQVLHSSLIIDDKDLGEIGHAKAVFRDFERTFQEMDDQGGDRSGLLLTTPPIPLEVLLNPLILERKEVLVELTLELSVQLYLILLFVVVHSFQPVDLFLELYEVGLDLLCTL